MVDNATRRVGVERILEIANIYMAGLNLLGLVYIHALQGYRISCEN
jgi:hypothetical protein